jgi:hypothetical protein
LVARLVTRLRHILKELGFMLVRMKLITADSFNPYVRSIASNGVRSSQAISMILEVSPAVNVGSGFDMRKLYEMRRQAVAQVKKTLQLCGNILACKTTNSLNHSHLFCPKSLSTDIG